MLSATQRKATVFSSDVTSLLIHPFIMWLKIDSALLAAPDKKIPLLTFSPEAEAPLSRRDLPILVAVAGVEEGPDAHFIFVQVDGGQLGVVQIEVTVGVQFREHPANGVLAAGNQALIQHCQTYCTFSINVCAFQT